MDNDVMFEEYRECIKCVKKDYEMYDDIQNRLTTDLLTQLMIALRIITDNSIIEALREYDENMPKRRVDDLISELLDLSPGINVINFLQVHDDIKRRSFEFAVKGCEDIYFSLRIPKKMPDTFYDFIFKTSEELETEIMFATITLSCRECGNKDTIAMWEPFAAIPALTFTEFADAFHDMLDRHRTPVYPRLSQR